MEECNGHIATNDINEKNEALLLKNKSLNRLDLSFMKHIDLKEYKKSNLLAYWLQDFANYHDNEKLFDSTTLKTFKRGDIVKANLGFNIGDELGRFTLLCCFKQK